MHNPNRPQGQKVSGARSRPAFCAGPRLRNSPSVVLIRAAVASSQSASQYSGLQYMRLRGVGGAWPRSWARVRLISNVHHQPAAPLCTHTIREALSLFHIRSLWGLTRSGSLGRIGN